MAGATTAVDVEAWIGQELLRGAPEARVGQPAWLHAAIALHGVSYRDVLAMGWQGALWAVVAPDDCLYVGAGETLRLEVQTWGWRRLTAGWRQLVDGTDLPAGFPLGGGFAFGRGRWAGFPAALFSLPALTLAARPDDTVEVRLVAPIDAWTDIARLTDRYQGYWRALSALSPVDAAPGASPVHPASAESFHRLVGRAAALCEQSQLDKVVVARSEQFALNRPTDPEALFRRIVRDNPQTFRFFVRRGERAFMGASPETLVRVQDRKLSTMCLAGTTERTVGGNLAASTKDRREHEWVRRYVRERLDRVARRVTMSDEPEVRWVGSIGHLMTPVEGELLPGRTIWDAAMALHPTPAVAGTPTREALQFIRAEEPLVRGWYAGGVGWVDMAGDGWLAVGLRSMLVEGRRATLFAGCGIVRGSDPAGEWEESTWKLRPMRRALEGESA